MEPKSSLTFVFDECLSNKIAETLDHCGKRLNIQIRVYSLESLGWRNRSDIDWIRDANKAGYIPVTSDKKMVSMHDIAQLVKSLNATLCILSPEISQLRRWPISRWMYNNLEGIANSVRNVNKGTTWIIRKNGAIAVVPIDTNECPDL